MNMHIIRALVCPISASYSLLHITISIMINKINFMYNADGLLANISQNLNAKLQIFQTVKWLLWLFNTLVIFRFW